MDAYYEVEARHYDVTAMRILDSNGYVSAYRRQIRLFDLQVVAAGTALTMTSGAPGILIVFSDQPPDALGTFNSTYQSVTVNAPTSDFADMYRIVQTEYPIHFRWTESPAGSGTVTQFSLNAFDEQVGEGLDDWTR